MNAAVAAFGPNVVQAVMDLAAEKKVAAVVAKADAASAAALKVRMEEILAEVTVTAEFTAMVAERAAAFAEEAADDAWVTAARARARSRTAVRARPMAALALAAVTHASAAASANAAALSATIAVNAAATVT